MGFFAIALDCEFAVFWFRACNRSRKAIAAGDCFSRSIASSGVNWTAAVTDICRAIGKPSVFARRLTVAANLAL